MGREPTLAEIRERHFPWPVAPTPPVLTCCTLDNQPWPCDVAILLSTIEKLEAVAEVAREVYEADAAYWRTVGNPETTQREHVAAHAVSLAAMVALLRALEGKP
ncbi:MAG: hypothetical protein WBF51_04035 [Candidatus Dormiibacterota bacterium]